MDIMTPPRQQAAKKLFDKVPGLAAAFLLGSAAGDRLRKGSDVDIAILPETGHSLPLNLRIELAVQLEDIFKRQVDLGILDQRNLIYVKEAYLKGRCIYSRNDFQRDLFGATALGLYAELKENRREVESAYQTTG